MGLFLKIRRGHKVAQDLLQPEDFTVTDQAGKARTFKISKFPAVQGREIIAKYPLSNVPKLGDYGVSEETMLKLMSFVGVEIKGGPTLRLSTIDLVNNHVGDWETLARIEAKMIEYNCSFFLKEKALTFFDVFLQMATSRVTEMLTASLRQSSPPVKPL